MSASGVFKVSEYDGGRLAALLPWPARDVNKYTRGKLTLVAGSALYSGAASLAAVAAQRMGAGYVEVACAPESVGAVRASRPSLVVRSWDSWDGFGEIAPREGHPCACVVGPGFDASGAAEADLVLRAVAQVAAPVLVDGGALSILSTEAGLAAAHVRAQHARALVMTPHGGEAARLARAAQVDRALEPAALVRALARAWRCVVALKGPDTFVSDGAQVVAVRQGTPALAKAGTGDVLAGMVGALLAQGLGALDACVLGVTLHAEAGRAAAAELTDICVTPEDVIEAIPQAVHGVG
ncbi:MULTISPECIES: NAD(P)H-hydrate dehydratase [unclassified Adlercreutzia]|uniref:NAD(P)H-hydrate dehydratase n=1 Tax=unclassified Adlercreutzia TaxID=2636013 RepID=UPI0013EC2EDA|nr:MULTISPECIES: NAD(P)H-hydrate dehydratase [unclassified Adlercreutzia]